ncbi:YidH family protein [Salinimicrobium sp. CAU 1759]
MPGKKLRKNKNPKAVKEGLITRDWLAIDRTRMANERTFLAYLRTFIVVLSSGVAIIKVDVLQEMFDLGIFLLVIAPIIFIIGLIRFIYVRRHIRKYHSQSS